MDPIIEVENLCKYYKQHKKEPGLKGSIKALFKRKYKTIKAVDKISFTINKGEMVGFIGPNGAGKTTTLKVLSGLLYPTSGEAKVLGYVPHKRQPEYQKQFSLVMGQKNQLWWDLPAIESFILNKEIYEVPDNQYKKTVNELSSLLDVKDILKVQVRKLSLGQRMKCELIAALLHSPRVLFLDEPTIGLDVVMQKKIREFFKEYNQLYKTTVILTSHYMDDVKELCQRIIMINKGKIVYDGDLEQIIKKYARNKYIKLIFLKEVEKKDISEYGKVVEYEPLKATIAVSRHVTPHIASEVLKKLPVDDVDIAEPELEDIIRVLFQTKKKI
ncbi:ATP-binding cassette domain-containing protein [Candidatus Dojkabacteria bacterium]|nr:ATP-binding cassette domain-containing protein [Candidatus Dojkabacteria bacterium]